MVAAIHHHELATGKCSSIPLLLHHPPNSLSCIFNLQENYVWWATQSKKIFSHPNPWKL